MEKVNTGSKGKRRVLLIAGLIISIGLIGAGNVSVNTK